MPYIFDPKSYSYVYYKEGTKPPKVGTADKDVIPGYSDYYYKTFPNQPASRQQPASTRAADGGLIINVDDPAYKNAGSGSTGSSSGSSSTTAQQNAYEYLKRIFEQYGLGTLAPKILEMVQKGYDPDTISLMLQDTSEYKQRFKANDLRRAKGISVLSPAEYLSLERQYRQLMSTAGLPAGFFDSNDDFTNWIAGDVSPMEIQERVSEASQALYSKDPYFIQALREQGVGDGDLVAYFLDEKRSLPFLQKAFRGAQIGAEASRNSLGINAARAQMFADLGVTQDQARNAYQTISDILPSAQKLGSIYGEQLGQTDLEDELLGGSGLASQKRKRLASKEAGAFSGSSGIGSKSLASKSRGEY